jgi:hypothetical protein
MLPVARPLKKSCRKSVMSIRLKKERHARRRALFL